MYWFPSFCLEPEGIENFSSGACSQYPEGVLQRGTGHSSDKCHLSMQNYTLWFNQH